MFCYILQVDKRLVFRVFEENLDAAFGFASANLSILTTGLPCLSSWLSINDLSGACKGQIKVVCIYIQKQLPFTIELHTHILTNLILSI